jgi:hypothetical protein
VNEKHYFKIHTSTLAVLLAGMSLALPIACDDDDRLEPTEGGTTGGEPSSGGNVGSGGASSGGKIGSGGAGGGASGGASSGGASSGGASSGGKANTGGGVPDGGDDDGGDGGVTCSGSMDANSANLCLSFLLEAVQPVSADPTLNGVGTLLVQVFNKAYPTGPADLIAQKLYPGEPSTTPPYSEQVAMNALPKIGFNNLPDTVYVRAYFVDNPNWFVTKTGLTWGMQIGGLDLNGGIRPSPAGVPAVRAITLTKNSERAFDMRLTATKKFTTTVMLYPGNPADPTTTPPTPARGPTVPADDGQGLLSVGVFAVQAPAEAAIFGGVEGRCVNVAAGPVTGVAGYFYTLTVPPTAGTTMYFGAQVNDFNTTTMIQGAPGGALISLTEAQTLPPSQKATVLPGQYSVVLDSIPTSPTTTAPSPLFLTAVNQIPDPRPATYQCPPPPVDPADAGGD